MKPKKQEDTARYEVTVWNNTNGNIEKYLHSASLDEAEELREWYADEPWCDVVVEAK